MPRAPQPSTTTRSMQVSVLKQVLGHAWRPWAIRLAVRQKGKAVMLGREPLSGTAAAPDIPAAVWLHHEPEGVS